MNELERIADLYERIKNVREAMHHVRFAEFGERNHSFENAVEAMRAIERLSSGLTEIHAKLKIQERELQDVLYQFINLNERGEEKTAILLYKLREWHPGSYKYYHEVWEILWSHGKEDFLRRIEDLMAQVSFGLIK